MLGTPSLPASLPGLQYCKDPVPNEHEVEACRVLAKLSISSVLGLTFSTLAVFGKGLNNFTASLGAISTTMNNRYRLSG